MPAEQSGSPTLQREPLLGGTERLGKAWGHTKKWPYKDNCKLHQCLKRKLCFFEIALAHADAQPQACACVKAACVQTHRTV